MWEIKWLIIQIKHFFFNGFFFDKKLPFIGEPALFNIYGLSVVVPWIKVVAVLVGTIGVMTCMHDNYSQLVLALVVKVERDIHHMYDGVLIQKKG